MSARRLVMVGFAVALLSGLAIGEGGQNGPTPYPDKNDQAAWPGEGPIRVFGWMTDNRNYFWTQRAKDQNGIVFIGDSLTGGWKDIQAAFPSRKVVNRGIGGDVTRGALFRLKEDVLDLKPTVVVVLIGSNDLSAHANTAGVARNIAAMLEQTKSHDAKLPIVLCTIPPRNAPNAPTKPGALADVNARIVKLAEGQSNIHLIDLFAPLANADGLPDPQYFAKDQLHLGPKGYEKWAALLEPIFASLKTE